MAHAVCLDDCPSEAWQAYCVNNSEKSAQGVTTPCYSGYAFSYDLKNNFIILNLVKTILTSINFDSLSERNLCLVIKKIYSKGVCNMKHTKNILKSLLITVMALSLLAVSCKKDEGGTKNPVNPDTPITITAQNITDTIKNTTITTKGVSIDFSGFNPANGAVSLKATITEAVTLETLKTDLESALSIPAGSIVTSTATAKVPEANSVTAVTIEVKIDAGKNTFADDVKTAYTVVDKVATVNITITPDKKWNGNEMENGK